MNLSPDYEERRRTHVDSVAELVIEPFVPRRGYGSAHVQTIASHLMPRPKLRAVPERLAVQIEDGVQVICLCHWQPERSKRLTVLIVHGLEGSSESQYVLGTSAKALAAGMNVVRMNVRGCGCGETLCRTLYHSGMSADIQIVVRELIQREGIGRIALVGFSMGGNQVLKLAGEWGGVYPSQVCSIAAVSPAMDLALSADALHLPSNRLYEWRFLLSLRQRLKRKLQLFPDAFAVSKWWWKSIRDFDDCVTAPHCGFLDAEDYYTRSSASQVVDGIAIPTLILHSKDDPFIRVREETREKLKRNSRITYIETDHGGHCAFRANSDGYDGRWAERQVVRFINTFSHR